MIPTTTRPTTSATMPKRGSKRGSLTERTVLATRQVLAGQRHGLAGRLAFVGPAVIASIAYIDPGNFATNIQAGAKYGYTLLWVVLAANVMCHMPAINSVIAGIRRLLAPGGVLIFEDPYLTQRASWLSRPIAYTSAAIITTVVTAFAHWFHRVRNSED